MQIDIRQLTYFVAVAEELHLGRAAQKLNVSQPPITRQIQQLEETLGSPLFIRHPKGVTLTPEGSLFLDEARSMLAQLSQAREKVRRMGQGELGRLDISMFGSAVLGQIPQIVLTYRQRFPGVKVVLHTLSKARQMDALVNRSIDIAFNRIIEPRAGLRIEELWREQLFLAVEAGSDLAQREIIPFREVADHPLILFPAGAKPGFMDQVRQMCAQVGIVPDVAQEVGDAVVGLALVASGFGISIVPQSLMALSLPGVVFRSISEFSGDLSVDLSCAYRDEPLPAVLRNFLSVAREVAASTEQRDCPRPGKHGPAM